jgi:hypothetical protein
MQLTPENLHLVDALLDDDPDAACQGGGTDDCHDSKATNPAGTFYDITDFPGGSWHHTARLTLCAACLAADDGYTHAELVANRALLDAARAGQPYEL